MMETTPDRHVDCEENTDRGSVQVERSISEGDFTCTCCYDLLVQPTTIECGHNFCRLCLASWFLQSKKRECPQCRQSWTGHPKVNVTLRSTISKLFGERAEQRNTEVEQNDNNDTLREFDRRLRLVDGGLKVPYWGEIFKKSMIVIGSSLVTALFMSSLWFMSRSSSEQLLVLKPVVKWSVDDVGTWVSGLGTWAAELYAPVFADKHIDGLLLLALEENDLITNLGLTNPLERRAFMLALNQVRELGVKPPTNLWEYKTVHTGSAVFYLVMLESNPRLCFLYMYLFDYEDSFIPFLYATTPFSSNHNVSHLSLYSHKFSEPSSGQLIEFFCKWLVFPFYLVAQFSMAWLDVHYWTSRLVIAQCFVLTMLEANTIRKLLHMYRNRGITLQSLMRYMAGSFRNDAKGLLVYPVVAILWHFIPSFVCDCIFYGILYLNPLFTFDYLWRELRRI